MAKPNKNRKKYYDAYKGQNRLERNKARKRERHERRNAKFAERKAADKCYVYDKETSSDVCESNVGSKRHTDVAKLESIFAKLDREILFEKMKQKSMARKEKDDK